MSALDTHRSRKASGLHSVAPVSSRRPAILTPLFDALSGGGLSIALIVHYRKN